MEQVETKKNEKLSYEQLENIAHQLSEQNKQMYMQLQQMNTTNLFKRLDYLFKVLEYSAFFSKEFIENCTQEIENMITIPKEDEKTE